MFINITSAIDTKYLTYSSGQAVLRLDPSKTNFQHIRLGIYKSPTIVEEYDPSSGMYDILALKNISEVLQCIGICAKDMNNKGLEDFIVTREDNKISYYTYRFDKNQWIRKSIQLPYTEPCTSITSIPNGFLIGNSNNPPLVLNTSGKNIELSVEEIDFDPRIGLQHKHFQTRSIINLKGLIKGLDGVILNGNNDAFSTFHEQFIFQLDKGKIRIEPWIESMLTNSTSATFVNVNPSKKIYGLLMANYGQEHILYLFKKDKLIGKNTLPGSYAMSVLAADFDNDGKDEIFVLNYRQHNQLYRVVDETNIEPIQLAQAYNNRYWDTRSNNTYTSSIAMDLDGDGFLELFNTAGDIFIGNALYKVEEMYKKNNRYLRVYPQNENGAPHRGAVVTIRYQKKKYKRIIDNGGNAFSQNEPIAHFGLGEYNGPIDVKVLWTDGTVTKSKNVKSNQIMIIKKQN